MLTVIVVTAVVLGVTLVVALVAVLVFVAEIRSFVADTAVTMETVDERATRLADRVQRIQHATAAAAGELSVSRT